MLEPGGELAVAHFTPVDPHNNDNNNKNNNNKNKNNNNKAAVGNGTGSGKKRVVEMTALPSEDGDTHVL
jgi:hypothetical protein